MNVSIGIAIIGCLIAIVGVIGLSLRAGIWMATAERRAKHDAIAAVNDVINEVRIDLVNLEKKVSALENRLEELRDRVEDQEHKIRELERAAR